MQQPVSPGLILLVVLVVGAVLLVRALRRSKRPRTSTSFARSEARPAAKPPQYVPPDQVAAVSRPGVVWQRRRVLNRGETAVYAAALDVIEHIDPSWRLWPQVSLGEAVNTAGRSEADREAFRWINSKRADFLVVNGDGLPLAVIEYQGSGHNLGNAAERDEVKRVVLGRAGIRYVEVAAPMVRTPAALTAQLKRDLTGAG